MTTSTLLTSSHLSTQRIATEPGELTLRMLPATSRAIALSEWRHLEGELANARLTCSSLWTEIWLNNYGTIVPHQFAIGSRGGKTCGIALLTQGVDQHTGPVSLNTWHVGTAGEPEPDSVFVEYNSLLVRPDDHIEFGCALWKWVREQTRCDEFRLDGFDSLSIPWILQEHPQVSVERKSSRFFDLTAARVAHVEPITLLGSQTRANIRRSLRDLGNPTGEWAETPQRAEEMFHHMVELHQARWNAVGQPGVYASRRFFNFHLELLHRAVPLGMSTIFGVKSSQQYIGYCHNMIDGQRVLLYQCGRVSTSGNTSPGMLIDYLCIAESLRRGYHAFDFLAGESDHKRRMSTNRAELAWVVWQRRNIKNAAINAVRNVKRIGLNLLRPNSATRLPPTADQVPSPKVER